MKLFLKSMHKNDVKNSVLKYAFAKRQKSFMRFYSKIEIKPISVLMLKLL